MYWIKYSETGISVDQGKAVYEGTELFCSILGLCSELIFQFSNQAI